MTDLSPLSSTIQRWVGVQPIPITSLGRIHSVQVDVLRLDQVDPVISGNKWFKLKNNLLSGFAQGYCGAMSFGGNHSNHLHALAGAGRKFGFPTLGWVRALDDRVDQWTPTLRDCAAWGMQLSGLSYGDYRRRYDPVFCAALQQRYPDYLLIPEGGSNALGVVGIAEMVMSVLQTRDLPYHCWVCPVGSGGTLAGVIAALSCAQNDSDEIPAVIGVSALKGLEGKLERTVAGLLAEGVSEIASMSTSGAWGAHAVDANTMASVPWHIEHQFHAGGFGRRNDRLLAALDFWHNTHHVQFDAVYTGKMMLAVESLIRSGQIPAGRRVLVMHTGGIQGLRG